MNTFEVIWKTTSETNLQSTKMESHQLNSLERFAASRPVVSNPTSEVVLVDELEAKGPDAEPTSGLLDATESTSPTTVDEAAERETASTEDTTDNVSTPTGASELLCAADSMEVELPEDYDLAADESLQILGETVSPTTSSEDADAEESPPPQPNRDWRDSGRSFVQPAPEPWPDRGAARD